MNTRYLVASALAAAIVAPVALSAQKPVPAHHGVQDREVLRHRQGRQERLRIDRQQLLRRIVEAQRAIRRPGSTCRPATASASSAAACSRSSEGSDVAITS